MQLRLALLGSTGSIGVQTLDIVRENPDRFKIEVLTANSSWKRLSEQILEFRPRYAVLADSSRLSELKEAVGECPTEILSGTEAVAQCTTVQEVDMVVNALVGYAGLQPTVEAIKSGKRLALANKETMVVGGELVTALAGQNGVKILPIDSEHSAIFQCLSGEVSPVRRLIITCSGGALRNVPASELKDVTAEQALKHPQWSMGAKITIDSATLVNKGFEVIEARWLFDMPEEKIYVIQHPQSIVHSMVEFEDGAIKAQLGTADMRVPISVALMYPERACRHVSEFSFVDNPQLTFTEIDRVKYPALDIAYECLKKGGTSACTMNAANEVAVSAFLGNRCGYLDIVRSIEYALEKAQWIKNPSLEDYAAVNAESRRLASRFLKID